MQRLSIVIPAKNEEHFLPILLESIKQQTLQPDEIIIADAGSTDGTVTLAGQYGCRVVKGGMPGPGRNAGARAAMGDIILFLDADVLLPQNDFLERGLEQFSRRDLAIATVDVIVPHGNAFDRAVHAFYNRYVRLWGSVHAHAPGFCMFVKKELHNEVGGFDETVRFCEDHDYAGRAAKRGRFGFLDGISIAVTTRRQERDGRLGMAIKYALAELHLLFFGPIRHDGFRYGFGYAKEVLEKVHDRQKKS